MPITTTDVTLKLSVVTGSTGNSTAQANPNNALGKFMSTTAMLDNTLNNLFDDVTGAESAAGDTEYRCLFLQNDHDTLTWEGVTFWLESEVAGGGTITVGLDAAGVVSQTSGSAQAAEIANESTSPGSVTFSSPTSGAPITIGNMNPNTCIGIWVRRVVPAAASALNNDGVTFHARGDTAA